jgi:hypothetical protein
LAAFYDQALIFKFTFVQHPRHLLRGAEQTHITICMEFNDDEDFIFVFLAFAIYHILYHGLCVDRNTLSAAVCYLYPAADKNRDFSAHIHADPSLAHRRSDRHKSGGMQTRRGAARRCDRTG